MRRRTDISGSRMNDLPELPNPVPWDCCCRRAQPRAQRRHPGMLLPGHADKAYPSHPHKTMPLSTRTSIDSPGLITSVGYILIAGRSAAVFG